MRDVRMTGFLERTDLNRALERLRELVEPLVASEEVALSQALSRILARDAVAEVDVPGFSKSAVDGYALRAAETFGASVSSPVAFELAGEVLPGKLPEAALGPSQAMRIMTGAPMPEGADSVLMAEFASEEAGSVLVNEPLTPGRNVATAGEDIRRESVVLRRGRLLRPQDLGVLSSIGFTRVSVLVRPEVAILTTGNELVPPEEAHRSEAGKVVNSNQYVLEALVRQSGGEPHPLGIARDDPGEMRAVLESFPGHMLITTGATSVGVEDHLPVLVAELGELVVHGINIKPGYPVGFGRMGSRPVLLLPGNPVAVMVCFDVLVRPMLQRMQGLDEERRDRTLRAPMKRKLASRLNRYDFVRVQLVDGAVEPLRSGGAGVLSAMSRADGFIIVPRDAEGLEAGETVEVHLF